MNAKEVHKLTMQELEVERDRLRRQLYDLRCQAVTEKLENPRQLRVIRRDIGRILTELRMRQLKEAGV